MSDLELSPQQRLAERVQFIAAAMLIIFPVGWLLWFYPYDDLTDRSGTPLGADYAMFYVAGQVVADGAADRLYDQAEHQQRLQALFPGLAQDFCLPYRYPPFVALLMAPLAQLPYAVSYLVFLATSIGLLCCALRLLREELALLRGPVRSTVFLAVAGWPVVLETWIGGQASFFGLLLAAAVVCCWRQRRWLLAGALLGLMAYKPNMLGLFALAGVLYRPQMLRGAVPILCALTGLSMAAVGFDGCLEYAALGTRLAGGDWDLATPYWKVHGLASWLAPLAPGQEQPLSCLLGLLLMVLLMIRWRCVADAERGTELLVLALMLTVNTLCNPYVPIYDLTLLALAALLTIESLSRGEAGNEQASLSQVRAAYLILPLLYFGPHLSQAIAKLTGCQFFPLALAAVVVWQAHRFWRLTAGASRQQTPELATELIQ